MSKEFISFLKLAGMFCAAILIIYWMITEPIPPVLQEDLKWIVFALLGACGIKVVRPGPPQVDHEELAKHIVSIQDKKEEPQA